MIWKTFYDTNVNVFRTILSYAHIYKSVWKHISNTENFLYG